MFSRQGDSRTDAENRLLAGPLALVSGFANVAGFVLIGRFVTGNVGRFASDVVSGRDSAAAAALSMVFAFFSAPFW